MSIRKSIRCLLLTASLLFLGSGSIYAQQESFLNRIKVKGYGQLFADYSFNGSRTTAATFGINKAEVLALGQITDAWSMGITVQLNKPVMLKDLYMQYAFMPQLRLRVGQFKTPFGHENQIAPFMNPIATGGSMPTVYFAGIATDPLYYGTAGRDLGVELSGDLWDKLLSYKLVAMNGQGLNTKDLNIGKLMGGSLYIRPLKGLSLHTSYLGGEQVAMDAAKGIKAGEQYTRHRASVGIIADYEPVTLSSEYMYGKDGAIEGMGAYITAAVHLPKRYDLVISGDYLQRDMKAQGALYSATLGVDKWFFGNCRLQLQYHYAHPTANMPVAMQGHTIRTQLQFAF